MQLEHSTRPIRRGLRLRSLEAALAELEKLQAAERVLLSADWDLAHTLDHCARSIRFAVQGFPMLKHPLFRALVGKAAFHVFDARGYMRHALDEEIPGCVWSPGALSVERALARLQQSISDFQACEGPLQPHFAYGRLDKAQFERANAMHLANHLDAMEY